MNKRTIFILFLVLLVIGCRGRGGGNEDYSTIMTKFHTGTEGIFIRFLPNTPPPESAKLSMSVQSVRVPSYTPPPSLLAEFPVTVQ